MAPDEGRFRLRGWRDARADFEQVSDDQAGLRARAARLLGDGYGRLDLEAWNLELNDWVQLERFEAG